MLTAEGLPTTLAQARQGNRCLLLADIVTRVSSRRPGHLLRLLFRTPIVLYRMRMGWLLGGRFLLLAHTGRKTGKTRRTVIEVVAHDQSVPEVAVIAAWGERAQWVRKPEGRSRDRHSDRPNQVAPARTPLP